ncbi:MAG: SpoIIIAH-like family protein [Lachnospiraceae bacterium]|nr:SpoIIIAH-like family protein [Lachnospiraceae bacterium]
MLKKLFKKNQLVIGALAVLLGVAGYINFGGNQLDLANSDAKNKATGSEAAFAENEYDLAAGEVTMDEVVDEEHIELNSDEDSIGEAVLTSADNTGVSMVNIKLNREQTRSKTKEYYLDIMNSDGMDEAAVQSATDAYIKMTEDMELETEAETMLLAKGFSDVMVTINDDSVDVVIGQDNLSDEEKAQIEDVVVRKTGCTIDMLTISLAK